MKAVTHPSSFNEWRQIARDFLLAEVPPHEILWQDNQQVSLFEAEDHSAQSVKSQLPQVPKAFIDLASTAACHRSNEQWALLYSILWRITHGEKHLLSLVTDPEIHRMKAMVKHISRDIHKMHAFVRFRKVSEESSREQFVAWFEPEHRIIRLTSSFFRKRFTGMDWSILTPDECMHWDGLKIQFTDGVTKSQAPDFDALDELWKAYYRSIFNPARLKIKAMQSEMPKKYWKNLPEAKIIEELITTSSETTKSMLENPASPEKPAPKNAYLEKLGKLDKKTKTNPSSQR